jgi:hypothetical protein
MTMISEGVIRSAMFVFEMGDDLAAVGLLVGGQQDKPFTLARVGAASTAIGFPAQIGGMIPTAAATPFRRRSAKRLARP